MTASGIVMPDTVGERPQEGEAIAVGPGRTLDSGARVPMEIKLGDTVLYAKYSGSEITLDGEDYLILRESDVLAISVAEPELPTARAGRSPQLPSRVDPSRAEDDGAD